MDRMERSGREQELLRRHLNMNPVQFQAAWGKKKGKGLSLKPKLIHHACIHPVYFGEFSFLSMYGQISRNGAFGR